MSRIAVFIDGAYLDKITQSETGGRADLHLLPERLAQGIPILRTYYYNCPPYQSNPPTPDEMRRFSSMDKFFSRISRFSNFEVRQGKCVKRGDDYQQKMVDVLLSLDLAKLSMKRAITHAALVAGDADYVPAVETAKYEGVEVWLYHGRETRPHNELWLVADKRYPLLDDYLPFRE
ncbi:NYN domain-containing protein [bacterium]|nr:NYN domain-containing protein [bacterium]